MAQTFAGNGQVSLIVVGSGDVKFTGNGKPIVKPNPRLLLSNEGSEGGIESAEAFGTPILRLTMTSIGIISQESFGIPSIFLSAPVPPSEPIESIGGGGSEGSIRNRHQQNQLLVIHQLKLLREDEELLFLLME